MTNIDFEQAYKEYKKYVLNSSHVNAVVKIHEEIEKDAQEQEKRAKEKNKPFKVNEVEF